MPNKELIKGLRNMTSGYVRKVPNKANLSADKMVFSGKQKKCRYCGSRNIRKNGNAIFCESCLIEYIPNQALADSKSEGGESKTQKGSLKYPSETTPKVQQEPLKLLWTAGEILDNNDLLLARALMSEQESKERKDFTVFRNSLFYLKSQKDKEIEEMKKDIDKLLIIVDNNNKENNRLKLQLTDYQKGLKG